MEHFQIRTDLALEAREGVQKGPRTIHGIRVEEYEKKKEDIKVIRVAIETKNASAILGKPMGTYITMEVPKLDEPDESYHREISCSMAEVMKSLIPELERKELHIMMVGLGNRDVTADSLGPKVMDHLYINRHIIQMYGRQREHQGLIHMSSCIEPGVMAKTGMESAEIVKAMVQEMKPDLVIAVDALAARSTKRLNRTIQISDSGIWPGSGVGNHRLAINQAYLGVPVVSVGIPTVVDAGVIIHDALENIGISKRECHQMFSEFGCMYMTGKDVDMIVKRISYTISEALNMLITNAENQTNQRDI